MTIAAEVPDKLVPLLDKWRYKGAYGGRGGAKSHFFAEQIVLRCYKKPLRVVCIREVQKSIRDSVRQLIVDKIEKFGLGAFYDPRETEIRGANGSIIIFRGMQHYTAESIKSLEGYDIAWIEEAQTLSQVSFDLLRPTIRKEGSEIWASWNPRHRTDPIDMFFRKNPPASAISVMVNWRDNPWFPDVLYKEMLEDKARDPDAAEHIWEGSYGVQAGAILGRWVAQAEKESRVHDDVEYEQDGPGVEITSDIGYRDTASWWFWQRRIGGFAILREIRDNGLEAADWIERIADTLNLHGYKLGKIWLPHDAINRTFNAKHSAFQQFASHFGYDKVDIVRKTSTADRINAARTIIKRCEFHEDDCEEGLDALRAWEYEWNPDLQVFMKEPLHNWASHPSDAFSYGCQVMQDLPAPKPKKEPKVETRMPTLNEIMKQRERRKGDTGYRIR